MNDGDLLAVGILYERPDIFRFTEIGIPSVRVETLEVNNPGPDPNRQDGRSIYSRSRRR